MWSLTALAKKDGALAIKPGAAVRNAARGRSRIRIARRGSDVAAPWLAEAAAFRG